ncbi:uncharacterized protein LOC108907397 [Anoplophora glabripennis]|uniref:uncharacterized protein LOC108907397 n=1 Tax=Anoplophora glabripennis TaxID=217634 RepID=UPI000874175B|nr:uncharacterized protein LOC108907397 [Anoplophora glabripennis]
MENNTSASENAKIEAMSKELIDLKEDVTDISKYFKEAFQRIRSDAEDVQCNMETGNTLKVGKKSVQSLIELKNLASDIFSGVRNNEIKCFNQEIDVTPIWRNIYELKNMNSETREIINLLESLNDSTVKLIEQEKNQKPNTVNGNGNESCASSISIASDPSISEFSLFDGSSTNAATSSPICKTEYPQNQDE